MRFLGVRVDVEAAHQLKDKLVTEEKETHLVILDYLHNHIKLV